jgi:hypothetical protein
MLRVLRLVATPISLLLVVAAAVASLFGPNSVRLVTSSFWFIVGAVIAAVLSLVVSILSLTRRRWATALLHVGLVIALVGIGVDEKLSRNGYLYLEAGAPATELFVAGNLRAVDELPFAVGLDGVSMHQSRGFNPAPSTDLTVGPNSLTVTYNRPLNARGRRLLLKQLVEPGFLQEYELAAGKDEYVLLHNQQAALETGMTCVPHLSPPTPVPSSR